MADTKISALASATTPLTGTEVLPIVQNNSTVKVTVANVVGAGTSPGNFSNLVTVDGSTGANFRATRYSTDNASAQFTQRKARGTSTVPTAVTINDTVFTVVASGYDGTDFIQAAQISSSVDGTPGTNDMPGRLVFSTTADGASSPTERMRIDNAGRVGIGGTPSAFTKFQILGTLPSSSTASRSVEITATIPSTSTAQGWGFYTTLGTQASSFTLTDMTHYRAGQGTIGASSVVTNQFGFVADSTITGATNNYGFYGDIPAGTNRFNFYAAGTASNFFGGNTIVSVTDNTNAALRITQLGTGNALLVEDSTNPDSSPFVIDATGKVAIGATTATENLSLVSDGRNFLELTRASDNSAQSVVSFRKARGTNASPTIIQGGDTSGEFQYYGYDGVAYTLLATIAGASDGTPGTNDMPGRLVFSTTADGAASPTERVRISSAGNVGIGGAANASAILDVQSTTKGVRMPNMTTTEKNAVASPAAGLMVFDTTLAKLCVYSGAAWQTITSI